MELFQNLSVYHQQALALFVILFLIILFLYGRYQFLKAENQGLKDRLDNNDGWRSESLYLRHHVN